MRVGKIALLSGASLLLGACAGPVILGVNIGTLSTIGSVASTAVTGRGLGEHAVSAIADKDCRLIEPIFRKDRQFCEENDSPARKEDFNGLADLFDKKQEAPATMVAEAKPAAEGDIVSAEPETKVAEARAVELAELAPAAGPVPLVEPVYPGAPPVVLRKPAAPVQLAAAPPAPRPKPAAERVAAPAPAGPYFVRVGTYANAGLADSFARKLREHGYQTRVSQMRGEGRKTFSVVNIVGFRDAATAERAAQAIARDHDLEPGLVLTKA